VKPGKIVVLGTGGTIAGIASNRYDTSRYEAAQHGIDHLLSGLPVQELTELEIISEQVAQIDSKDMDHQVWRQLLVRCHHWLSQPDVAGLVITHGTDTIEETAYFLHRTLAARVPVVLTCAMRPANALLADGPQNLVDSLVLASQPQVKGVMVLCAGTLHNALDVQKAHAWRLDAFSSGDAGPLGHLVHGRLRQVRAWPEPDALIDEVARQALSEPMQWPRVEIVTSHAGANGALVDALMASPSTEPVRGLVVAGTGGGTVHQALLSALQRAQAQGIRVIYTSRSCRGMPTSSLRDQRVVYGLSPAKARIALMLELLCNFDPVAE